MGKRYYSVKHSEASLVYTGHNICVLCTGTVINYLDYWKSSFLSVELKREARVCDGELENESVTHDVIT